MLKRNLDSARPDLDEAIFRAYHHAGDAGGLHTVQAAADSLETMAEIRISTAPEVEPESRPPGKQVLKWRGMVAPQKWMNFYTKLLTRFASNPELKLEVSFSVPLDAEAAKSKADETRAGLKELGLDDDVNLS